MSEQAVKQYLTFGLDGEVFALDIVKVREVLELTDVSKLPLTPDHMKGVINIRGHAIPVVDMRSKLGMDKAGRTVDTCIIILDVLFESGVLTVGIVVDSVREVIDLSEEAIEPPPRLGSSVDASYMAGLGYQGDQFIILLDADSIFADEEVPLKQAPETKAA
ncbi:chemotaxis protein CheW [Pseudodesulfovibrio indicus]|uniref:CheW protein n=1 Tax=Pseudodesulfovibrio indicus TaxID=1716143 RepID=A0A126QN56_9BACT|nr:chemotaxis protein CheW [Pseudodesulfovibrio indicus]AMK11520.1 chemotaxis protein CheW [Pseudodesulfovibrio indicus]TDT89921.1 CheW protein [Pseudodesulfovibrio indicus]